MKFSEDFNELLSFLVKTTGSGQKMAETTVVQKNGNWRCAEAKG